MDNMAQNRLTNKKNKSEIYKYKKNLERVSVIFTFVITYIFMYTYQNMLHIEITPLDLKSYLSMPIVTLVIFPIIFYLYVKNHPLEKSDSENVKNRFFRRMIEFFQNEFPSKYILERCKRCKENENSCPNYIKEESQEHIKYWFYDIFHGAIEKEDPERVKRTYEKGYICKLYYIFILLLIISLTTSIIVIIFHHVYILINGDFRFDISSYQILFPLFAGGIILFLKNINYPYKDKPTGCWHAWREINRIHIFWLKDHEDFLVNLICQKGNCIKRFREK